MTCGAHVTCILPEFSGDDASRGQGQMPNKVRGQRSHKILDPSPGMEQHALLEIRSVMGHTLQSLNSSPWMPYDREPLSIYATARSSAVDDLHSMHSMLLAEWRDS